MSGNTKLANALVVTPALALCALFYQTALPALSAQDDAKVAITKVPSSDEIANLRRDARQDLMLPSLIGIRGVACGVVGDTDTTAQEKEMAAKLSDLSIPVFKFSDLKEGVKPVDALVELRITHAGHHSTVNLFVTQWVSLDRAPKTKIKAVTYRNQMIVLSDKLDDAVNDLSQQFVVDYLKANKRPLHGAAKSAEAQGDKSGSSKGSSK